MNKGILYIFGLASAIVLLFFANLAWGSVSIPCRELLAIFFGEQTTSFFRDQLTSFFGRQASPDTETFRYIVMESRLPQAMMALLSGAALATSGLLLQTAFRNPLAGPDIFGISSGAGLAVAIVMLASGGNFLSILLAAFIGAMLVLALITLFSTIVRSNTVLLIIGLMVGYLASSAISLLNFFSTAEGVKSYMIWGMGSFGNVSMGEVRWFVPIAMLGLLSALLLIKPLNAMLLGDRLIANNRFAHGSGHRLLRSYRLYRSCHSAHSPPCHRHREPSSPASCHHAYGFRISPALQPALHIAGRWRHYPSQCRNPAFRRPRHHLCIN